MSTIPVTAPDRSALAAVWRRARQHTLRSLGLLAAICLGIALVTYGFDGRRFGFKLAYSFSIGLACLGVIEGGRFLMAAAFDAVRHLRRLPPSAAGFESGWRGLLLLTPLAVLAGPPLGGWIADAFTGLKSPNPLDWSQPGSRTTLILAFVGTAASIFIFSTMERLAHARAEAEAARRAAAENQLRLLQSQLEPHMLFNTLANLRVLIGLDAERAQAMLDRLIAFLRSTLSASRQPAHALADEFRHLDDYLGLMAVRMGPRLQVSFDLPPELATLPVPPLLLQPLVENAIKHGLEPKVAGGRVAVSARREGLTLVLRVRDTGLGPGAAATDGTGFGLEQVRARLATLHGTAASLTLAAADDADGGTLVTLVLPLPAP